MNTRKDALATAMMAALASLSTQGFEMSPDGSFEFDDTPGYDAAGWSTATSNGCRSHQLVDEQLRKLGRGDAIERQVAKEFSGHSVCIDPMTLAGYTNTRSWNRNGDPSYVHPFEAEDFGERARATRAAYLARVRAYTNSQAFNDYAMDDDIDGDGERDHRVLHNHAVLFAAGWFRGMTADEVMRAWPAYAVGTHRRTA